MKKISWLVGALFSVAVILLGSAVSAAVLEVGDHGTYSSIQAAVNAALGAGSTEIRVEQGTYVENLSINSSFVSDQVEITGGWDAAFALRSDDASLTVIDGSAMTGAVVGVWMSGGTLLVDGFTVTNGVNPIGGGFHVSPSGGWVTISNNRIVDNTASGILPGGAGVYFREQTSDARLSLADNLISGNTSENTGSGSASGGGVMLYAHDGSAFWATGNRIIDNTCIAPEDAVYGCGVNIYIDSSEGSSFSDNVVKGHRAVTAFGTDVRGMGGDIVYGPNASEGLTMRRNVWIDNRDLGSPEGYHVRVILGENNTLKFSDSVIAGSLTTGLGLSTSGGSTAYLTNLTVFDHPGTGVHINSSGPQVTFYNSIVYGSTTPTAFVGGSVSTGGNLLGIDPLFVDPATWDCRLRAWSPALDSGDMSPPGGLGDYDADGSSRVLNGVVDIGAYEGVATLFVDGFESGLTSAWSSVVP